MKWQRAIVLGAGISGLFAARTLSEHFSEVLILERDALDDDTKPRNGTPQARHLHQILAGGQRAMEELFPSLPNDLAEVGAPSLHWGVDNIIFNENGRLPSVETGIITNTCSRPTLEAIIRKRVLEIDNVQMLSNHRVVDIVTDSKHQTVTGIQAQIGKASETITLYGDLLVDAMGKNTSSRDWYQQLGYEVPTRTYINAHVGYSTCWFEIPHNLDEDFVMIQVADLAGKPPAGQGQRSGVIIKMEGNRWVAILASNNKDYPPTTLPEFLEYSKTLRSDIYYQLLKDAKPLTPVYGSRSTHNVWYHYEKLNQLPENFIIVGDAVCSFNPLFGQGMSVATMDAVLLGERLAAWNQDALSGFAMHFQKHLAHTRQMPWALSTANDKTQPAAEGDISGIPFVDSLQSVYFNWVLEAMDHDKQVLITFFEVLNMLKPPTQLAHPDVLFRVLRHKLTGYSNMA